MWVYYMEVSLAIPEAHSLKDKRRITQSILKKMRDRYNISIVEADKQDSWQEAVFAIAGLAANRAKGDRAMEGLLAFIDEASPGDVRLLVKTYL